MCASELQCSAGRPVPSDTDDDRLTVVENDGFALDVLGGACLRVQRHRSRGPQKRLCWRRAAASPGAARRARLRSRGSRGLGL